jgi:hypothetical protein
VYPGQKNPIKVKERFYHLWILFVEKFPLGLRKTEIVMAVVARATGCFRGVPWTGQSP